MTGKSKHMFLIFANFYLLSASVLIKNITFRHFLEEFELICLYTVRHLSKLVRLSGNTKKLL